MKNIEQKEGWINRNTDGLPKESAIMRIISTSEESVHLCEWTPFDKTKYTEKNMPGEGYLGTCRVISEPFKGIGFHAWEQNDYEFIYYQKLTKKNYLAARPNILLMQLPVPFLRQWCEEDGKSFDVLMYIFGNVPKFFSIHGKKYSFHLDLIQRLVKHLDTRFEVIKLLDKKGSVIKVY